LQTKNSFFKK